MAELMTPRVKGQILTLSGIEEVMHCVILAGGLGTRISKVYKDTPKHLIPINGRPFADYQLAELKREGVTDVFYALGHFGEKIEDYVSDGSRFGVRAHYIYDGDKLLGTGGAIRQLLTKAPVDDPFFVIYGDSYLRAPLRRVMDFFKSSNKPALMTVFHNQNQFDRSNVRFNNGTVELYDKKSSEKFEYIDYGITLWNRKIIEERIDTNTIFDLSTLMHELSIEGKMAGFEVRERFYEIGSLQGIEDLSQWIK